MTRDELLSLTSLWRRKALTITGCERRTRVRRLRTDLLRMCFDLPAICRTEEKRTCNAADACWCIRVARFEVFPGKKMNKSAADPCLGIACARD
jgi:hypothetical protein